MNIINDNKIKNINEISDEDIGYDIGPKTIKEFTHILKNSTSCLITISINSLTIVS